MKLIRIITITLFCLSGALCDARPPKVIKMYPENGAVDVKPGPIKIRFLFDQDMRQRGHSLCGGGENFPEIIGEPKWASKRAFVFSANLEANHDYSFGVNCPSAQNFKSIRGESAGSLVVQFRTAGTNGKQTEVPTKKDSPTWKHLSLLDADTRSLLSNFEKFFSSCYQYPQEYTNASESQKKMLEEKWSKDLSSRDPNTVAVAASCLGMVRSQSGSEPLENILSDPPNNGRLRWVCTRALGQIGQMSSIPILISLLDDTNSNTRVYARVSLADITGVYFEDDKKKWTAWSNDPSSVTYTKNQDSGVEGTQQRAATRLREAIDNRYSYKDEKDIDWDKLFEKYSQALSNAANAKDFAKNAALMLSHAKDKHIWLKADGEHVSVYRKYVTPNANLELLPKLVPDFKKHNANVSSGRFSDGIGYIYIGSWSRHDIKDFDQLYPVLNQFSDAPGLIIDVRGNSGGSEPIALDFAGCFVDEPKLYAKHVTIDPKSPNKFTAPRERTLQPNKLHPQYRGKVTVLSGPFVMSSCEAFILMMKQVPGCKIIGAPTQGSSGNPKPHDLGNGVTVYLPSWKAMSPDGTCFEGKGIRPDIPVRANPKKITTKDPAIEAALKVLRSNR
ncbi:MAG: S41 family peptidase [Planctomycetota bacterium]